MRVYVNSDCELSMQSYGSTWLMVLRGNEDAINETFNGLFNLCATNGKTLNFTDQNRTTATFWSSEKQMRKFFNLIFYFRCADEKLQNLGNNRDLNRRPNGGQANGEKYKSEMKTFVESQIEKLRLTMETFMRYVKRDYNPLFELSGNSAEKPDDDFKDAVLNHAFKERNETSATMAIDND